MQITKRRDGRPGGGGRGGGELARGVVTWPCLYLYIMAIIVECVCVWGGGVFVYDTVGTLSHDLAVARQLDLMWSFCSINWLLLLA